MKSLLKLTAMAVGVSSLMMLPPSLAWGQVANDVDCNRCVDSTDIATGTISSSDLRDGAVTRAHLPFDAITPDKLAEGAVDTENIRGGIARRRHIKRRAVTSATIANGTLEAVDFAAGSITTDKIADEAITSQKIGGRAIRGSVIGIGAITAAKIKPGAVDSDRLADGSVHGRKIQAGGVTNVHLDRNAVTNNTIAAGAITTAKLASRTIGVDKLAPGVLSGAGGLVPLRTIVIGPDNSPGADICAEIRTAFNSITDASAENPYLIKLEPGIYDCGTGAIATKPFVDLEGSGETSTILRSRGDGQTLNVFDNSEARHLRAEHLGGADGFEAVFVFGGHLANVTATAENAAFQAVAVWVSAPGIQEPVTLTNVTAIAESTGNERTSGIFAITSTVLTNVTARASGNATVVAGLSLFGTGNGATARNSVFEGDLAVELLGSGFDDVNIASSQLVGGKSPSTVYRCVAAHDGNFAELDANCD